jgi:type IV pilus assembly protein PilW
LNNSIKNPRMQNSKFNKQLGFTLVELMVALALSLLVVAASVSALLVSRQGFTSIDAASQLRDNARFATDFITRLSVQSGFKDTKYVDTASHNLFKSIGTPSDPDTPVFGFNNAKLGSGTDPLATSVNNSRNTNCLPAEGTACANGSDILVLRYQAGSRNTDSVAGSGPSEIDNAMFNCAGIPEKNTPTSPSDVIESMLYVDRVGVNLEPTLMCKYRSGSGASWENIPTPLVQGVESFQILYGTDGVVAKTVPVARAPIGVLPNISPLTGQPDSVPDRYLRADELTVAGNEAATKENWRRVRSLRIGLIVRGAPGSAQDRGVIPALTPLGAAFANPLDKQSSFEPIPPTGAPAGSGDGRLRQVVTFTIYLHNFQVI